MSRGPLTHPHSGSILLHMAILVPLLSYLGWLSIGQVRRIQKAGYSATVRQALANRILKVQLNLEDTVNCSSRLRFAGPIPKRGEPPVNVTIVGGLGRDPSSPTITTDLVPNAKADGLRYTNVQFDAAGNYNGVNALYDGDASLSRAGRTVRYQMGKLVIVASRYAEVTGEARIGSDAPIRNEIPILIVADDTNGTFNCTTRTRYLYYDFITLH